MANLGLNQNIYKKYVVLYGLLSYNEIYLFYAARF